ncbi:unnamed protein product [Discosporangium mesarthrocarpum]
MARINKSIAWRRCVRAVSSSGRGIGGGGWNCGIVQRAVAVRGYGAVHFGAWGGCLAPCPYILFLLLPLSTAVVLACSCTEVSTFPMLKLNFELDPIFLSFFLFFHVFFYHSFVVFSFL